MASIFDDLFSVFRENKDIAMAGAGIYDFFQDRKQGGELKNFEQNIPQVDPFGSANRSIYQNELAKLYQDPSYIANLPGYQFARAQGEKGIDRAAAKRGQFYSGNTLYQLSNFNQDLAGQFYDEEMKRLMQLSGANFPPNAGEAANLFKTGQQLQGNAPGNILAGLDKAGAQGTLDGLMNILSGGKTAADLATGKGATGGLMEALKGLFQGGSSLPASTASLAGNLAGPAMASLGAGAVPGLGTGVLASTANAAAVPSMATLESLVGGLGTTGPLPGLGGASAASTGATAAGAAPASGGLLAGGLGTALGAAAPLALVAFGMGRSGARKAKQRAAFKPHWDSLLNTPVTNLNISNQATLDYLKNNPGGNQPLDAQGNVLGRIFEGGKYAHVGGYGADALASTFGTGRSLGGVVDLQTGAYGGWSPGRGFSAMDLTPVDPNGPPRGFDSWESYEGSGYEA